MSTRSSISLIGPIHIYVETLDGDVCIEIDRRHEPGRPISNQYDDPILTRLELIELRDDISEYLENTACSVAEDEAK